MNSNYLELSRDGWRSQRHSAPNRNRPEQEDRYMARADNGARTDSAQPGIFHEHCRHCGCAVSAANTYRSDPRACRECIKTRVRENRAKKADFYRAYDRTRYREQPVRKEAAKRSAASPAGVAARKRSAERTKAEQPQKRAARVAVGNAIRDGKLNKEPCFFCGSNENIHAHHPDYAKALEVFWLCSCCHGKLHTVNGDFLRQPRGVEASNDAAS